MSLTKIHEIIAWIVVSQSALLSLFIFINGKRKISRRILSVFLLLIMCIYCNCLVGFNYDFLYTHFPHIINFFSPFWYLLAPSIYFLVKSAIEPEFRFRPLHILHAIPFIINMGYNILGYHIHDADTKRMLLDNGTLYMPNLIMNGISHILIFSYLGISLWEIKHFKRNIYTELSAINKKIIPHLNFIVLGYGFVWLFWVMNYILYITAGKHYEILSVISKLSILNYTATLVWNGLKNPDILTRMEYGRKTSVLYSDRKSITNEMDRIMIFIRTEKPYLDPDLTISELASQLDISQKQLSFLINTASNKNFCDFINTFRIEEAKKLLSDLSDENKTVLEVLYDSGFNSKSAFHNAFKKITHVTPTEFRKQFMCADILRNDFSPVLTK
jgi:AraC-like DNA-binding protein